MIKRKSMLALLLAVAMLCTCLPVAVFAADKPAITYGLSDGVIVDVEEIIFGVSNITTAPSVTIGGVAIDPSKITYADGTVTVDATNDNIAFGSNAIVVTASATDGGEQIFSGNIMLEKFAAPADVSCTASSLGNHKANEQTGTTNTAGNFDVYFANPGDVKLSNLWTWSYNGTSSSDTNARYGIYDTTFTVKGITNKVGISGQVFYYKSDGTQIADVLRFLHNGYLGAIEKEENAFSATPVDCVFRLQVNQYSGKYRTWVKIGDSAERFIAEGDLSADVKAYGVSQMRIQFFNQSANLGEDVKGSEVNFELEKKFNTTRKQIDTVKISSVTADGATVTANSDGVYELLPVTNSVEIAFNKTLRGTVNLGSAEATVSSSTVKFDNLNLDVGALNLTVPASAYLGADGVAKLGNKFVANFNVSDEFAVASPIEGASYAKTDKIFNIYESDKTVTYTLNGTVCEKAALASNVKTGKNVLGMLIKDSAGSEYKRITFYVNEVMIYGTQNDAAVSNGGVISTKKTDDNGVSYYQYKSTNVQFGTLQAKTILRDQESGTNRDNRFLSGKFVFEADMLFGIETDSEATVDSVDSNVSFRFRDTTTRSLIQSGAIVGNGEKVAPGKWYNVKSVVDMPNKCFDFYVDGRLTQHIDVTTDYMTKDDVALVQYIINSKNANHTVDIKNAKYYFEVPVGIEDASYSAGNVSVTTALRIPDSEITTTNIQLIVDGENIATSVAKNTTDSDYLGAGVEANNGTKSSYYEENGQKVFKPLWYAGTKGTKMNLAVNAPAGAKKGELVIKAGTKVVATDWKYTTTDDNGANTQKLIALENDVVCPVYFTENGIYAEMEKIGDDVAVAIISDGSQAETTLISAIAKKLSGSFDVTTKDYTVSSGSATVATDVISADTTSATAAKAMLWFKNTLKPVADFVTLK